MKITFLGATKIVTGSNFLVEAAGKKFLVDCGLYQGKAELEEQKEVYLRFINTFLECFKQEIKQSNKDILLNLIYKFRYYMLIPFNTQNSIKDVPELKEEIIEIEKEFMKIGKREKIISKEVPFEVWTHIFETRIIDLEELYYKIFTEYDKKYFQLFDDNISEEKFIINNIEKNKINKKIKIFN